MWQVSLSLDVEVLRSDQGAAGAKLPRVLRGWVVLVQRSERGGGGPGKRESRSRMLSFSFTLSSKAPTTGDITGTGRDDSGGLGESGDKSDPWSIMCGGLLGRNELDRVCKGVLVSM